MRAKTPEVKTGIMTDCQSRYIDFRYREFPRGRSTVDLSPGTSYRKRGGVGCGVAGMNKGRQPSHRSRQEPILFKEQDSGVACGLSCIFRGIDNHYVFSGWKERN